MIVRARGNPTHLNARGGPVCHERVGGHQRNGPTAEQVDIVNDPNDFAAYGTRALDSDWWAAPADLGRRSGRLSGAAADLSIGVLCRLARFTGGIQAEWRQPVPELQP